MIVNGTAHITPIVRNRNECQIDTIQKLRKNIIVSQQFVVWYSVQAAQYWFCINIPDTYYERSIKTTLRRP